MTAVSATFDDWSVSYYDAMAAVTRLGQALNQRALMIALPARFWSAASKFKSALTLLQSFPQACDRDTLVRFIKQTESLHRSVDELLAIASQRGYTNRSLFAASLRYIRKYNIELQDFIETFRLSLDPELRADIETGMDEYRRGETVSLESLFRN